MSIWSGVVQELELWENDQRPARLWLRDDDAIKPTPALERLGQLTKTYNIPSTIAVVPKPAIDELIIWAQENPNFLIALHGYNHTNHALAGEKKCELGLQRDKKIILDELSIGIDKLTTMFGVQFFPMLVPPWNRIDDRLIDDLSDLGISSLSTYSWQDKATDIAGLTQLNTHIDIIDWKGNRGGRSLQALADELKETLQIARSKGGAPVGILTHHLVHDENAWKFLEQIFQFSEQSSTLKWCSAKELVQSANL